MVSGFNFNEKELQRLMQPQMNQIAAEYTKEHDGLLTTKDLFKF